MKENAYRFTVASNGMLLFIFSKWIDIFSEAEVKVYSSKITNQMRGQRSNKSFMRVCNIKAGLLILYFYIVIRFAIFDGKTNISALEKISIHFE